MELSKCERTRCAWSRICKLESGHTKICVTGCVSEGYGLGQFGTWKRNVKVVEHAPRSHVRTKVVDKLAFVGDSWPNRGQCWDRICILRVRVRCGVGCSVLHVRW